MRRGADRVGGFSLLELVIVMALAAAIAAISVPTYTAYVARAYRSEARAAALESGQWLHRYRTERGSFANAADNFPAALRQVRANGRPLFDVAVVSTAETFTVTVTPTARGPMDGDVCAAITLDHTGARGVTGEGAQRADCWGR